MDPCWEIRCPLVEASIGGSDNQLMKPDEETINHQQAEYYQNKTDFTTVADEEATSQLLAPSPRQSIQDDSHQDESIDIELNDAVKFFGLDKDIAIDIPEYLFASDIEIF